MKPSASPPRILLLEDDDLDAELIATRLEADGITLGIERATTQGEYRALLAQANICLVLSDFSLPAYDGFSALEAARVLLPDIPFIFVSGAIGEERAIETMRRGATDYVLKDRLERLGPAVKRALTEAETRRFKEQAETERDQLLISERQARETAEAANRMKDDFLAIVSHELRTPLNAILGWASLLVLGKSDEEKQKRGLDAIAKNARMQARIIDDILDVSRIVSGKLDLHPSSVSVDSFVLAAVEALRPVATAKDIEIEVELSNQVQELYADGERLQQVVWNLMTNAVKFTSAGGRIRIATRLDNEQLALEVSDTGVGIESSLLSYVFEAFRQGDASKTRAHRGLGLGLAIVRHLVELHGGTVQASSEGLGRGSTFTVWLPLGPPTAASPVLLAPDTARYPRHSSNPAPADIENRLTGVRVLVVDDDPEARDIVTELLQASGAIVTACGSVRDALQAVHSAKPQVVVSDIGMPQADGYSLLRQLRALAPDSGGTIPAIALTAYARDIDRIDAQRAGYQRHMTKPVSPRALISAVVELVGSHAPAETPTDDGADCSFDSA